MTGSQPLVLATPIASLVAALGFFIKTAPLGGEVTAPQRLPVGYAWAQGARTVIITCEHSFPKFLDTPLILYATVCILFLQ